MSEASMTLEERFAMIVEELLNNPGVTPPGSGSKGKKGFGEDALKIHNKIFAMLVGERLVVKLPKARVDAIIAEGNGERFDPRKDGRVMKEWVCVEATFEGGWLSLAKEAMEFVGTQK